MSWLLSIIGVQVVLRVRDLAVLQPSLSLTSALFCVLDRSGTLFLASAEVRKGGNRVDKLCVQL